MAEMLAARTWRDAAADALEAREAAINGALLGLGALDGMFAERPEMRDSLRSTVELLRMEAENLRREADRVRGDG